LPAPLERIAAKGLARYHAVIPLGIVDSRLKGAPRAQDLARGLAPASLNDVLRAGPSEEGRMEASLGSLRRRRRPTFAELQSACEIGSRRRHRAVSRADQTWRPDRGSIGTSEFDQDHEPVGVRVRRRGSSGAGVRWRHRIGGRVLHRSRCQYASGRGRGSYPEDPGMRKGSGQGSRGLPLGRTRS